ncbi:MAG: metallopeptidase family protein [Deferrisomatales bacterium]
MDRRRFEHLVEQALASLPPEILAHVDNVVFLVEDWPDPETLDALGIGRRDGLLGLYQGCPLPERSTEVSGVLPDRVVLYQRPIERHAAWERLPVRRVIRETLIHEVGHYLGLDESELAQLEGRRAPEEEP